MGEVEDDVNDEILPTGQKRTRTPKNYAKMFEDIDEELTDDSNEVTDNESDTSVYKDEEANQPDQGDLELESLLEKVHISSPIQCPTDPSATAVGRLSSTVYNSKQPVSGCSYKEKMNNNGQPNPRTDHPTEIINICLPPGPLGIIIKNEESRCVIEKKKENASKLLKVNDTILSLNGIVLNGNIESWVTLFRTYSSQMMRLVVKRTNPTGSAGYAQQSLFESGLEEKKDEP